MNFKQFSTSDNQWHDVPYYQHKTATDTLTLPAVIYPNDTSITVGLKGQTFQNGTPTPSSPVAVNGTGERTENLFDYKTVYASYIDSNGNIATTANNLTAWQNFTADDIGKTITISLYVSSISASYIRVQGQIGGSYITGNAINANQTGFTEITVTPTSTSDRWRITYGTGTPDVVLNQVMVAVSATRKDYEPWGYKIPISMGGTTNNVYLGEVQTTRKVKKLVLTGEETWASSNNVFYRTDISDYARIDGISVVCSHFSAQSNVTGTLDVDDGCICTGIGQLNRLFVKYTAMANTTAWKAYLAEQYANGTPVTVWYVLSSPTTGITNEPIRKIGDYADEVSGITIPTIAGANTLTVDTTLQPSEVTATYKGWHPVADVHESESGQWD